LSHNVLYCSQIRELLADGQDGLQKHKDLVEVGAICWDISDFYCLTLC